MREPAAAAAEFLASRATGQITFPPHAGPYLGGIMEPTSPPAAAAATPSHRKWLWPPSLIVFISSACIMVLELVAGRIIAPHVGVSLYTWTSVIGVVLAGISLGNYLGGRMADRWASPRLLGILFVLGGLASVLVVAEDSLDIASMVEWPLILEILLLITALFFIPAAVLGTISPVVVKLAVHDLSRTGSTVGRIYAAGSVGSIVGTFATGFLLISWFGTHLIVWGVALVLVILGLLILLGRRWLWALPALLLLAGGSLLASRLGWLDGPCTRETNYFCIIVKDEERDGEPVRVLILDRLVHSYTSLNDPTKLVYGYERAYADVTAYQAQRLGRLSALFIGGGGYTFPRYMEAVYPGSELDVIEIDPGVTQVAYDSLGLQPEAHIVTYNEDARMFLAREPARSYDLILGDAFNDFSVPYHLTTREFNDRVRAWLADDGYYVVNIIDGAWGDFLRAYTRTLRQTFRHVYLAPTISSWREASRSTFVLIAGDTPLDLDALKALDGGSSLLKQQLLTAQETDVLLAEGRLVMLTDRYAPVDQMLVPVFQNKVAR
ncbi:MAG: fused MFS/spermidine synthase [Anaerolineae bacterium]|nr:fused MFS/spermidine synthase [Anaerolineae bacterium]